MSNVLLSWDNAIVGGMTAYNDGWWTYTSTINNLATPDLSMKWVTPGLAAADTRCTVGFTEAPEVSMIGLCSHNLQLFSTVRIRGSSDPTFATVSYDSGTVQVNPVGTTYAALARLRRNYFHKLSTPLVLPYWRIEIVDTGNPDGFCSVGRLFVGTRVWQPSVNMLAGAGVGWESNSTTEKTIGGAEWTSGAEPHRVLRFGLQLPESEMLANGFDLQRVAAGARREVVAVWDPADTVNYVRRSLLGRLRTLSPIEAPYYATNKTAFEIKELL